MCPFPLSSRLLKCLFNYIPPPPLFRLYNGKEYNSPWFCKFYKLKGAYRAMWSNHSAYLRMGYFQGWE